MRMVFKISIISLLISLFIFPAICLADEQMPGKLERDIFPGTTYISYAGQNLRFTTDAILHITLQWKGFGQIELRFKAKTVDPPQGGANQVSPDDQVIVYWENWSTEVYGGQPPEGEWLGILHTESGFTEK